MIIIIYCAKKSLNFISQELTSEKDYAIETPIYFGEIARTPDLLIKDKNGEITIYDHKTYSSFNKELKDKALLQMTAYYWILTNNGYKVNKTACVNWINKYKEEKILINITEDSLSKWAEAITKFKEVRWE